MTVSKASSAIWGLGPGTGGGPWRIGPLWQGTEGFLGCLQFLQPQVRRQEGRTHSPERIPLGGACGLHSDERSTLHVSPSAGFLRVRHRSPNHTRLPVQGELSPLQGEAPQLTQVRNCAWCRRADDRGMTLEPQKLIRPWVPRGA